MTTPQPWQLMVDMVLDYLWYDKYYDPKQDIWKNVVKIGDKYTTVPSGDSSRKTFIPLSLHFISVSSIKALITALTAFKVGRNDLIRVPSAFRNLSI